MRIGKVRIATFLIAVLMLGGCSGEVAQDAIPELKAPVAANAAYRPVELGDIGETKVLYGTVVPMEYCSFYDTSVEIKEITVEVGDYVEEGDILAYVDIDMARTELEAMKLQLENIKQTYELNMKISQLRAAQIAASYDAQIDLLRNAVEERQTVQDNVSEDELPDAKLENGTSPDSVSENDLFGGSVSGNDFAEGIGTWEELHEQKAAAVGVALENLNYDEMLHEYRVEKLQEEIINKQKILEEGTIRAPHSGYVVYTKSMGTSTEAVAYENIVVLADPTETYIELNDMSISQYAYRKYADYEVKYLQLSGEAYDVTELSYGVEAEVFSKASGKYPNARLTCPDAPRLTVGETYPILYREKENAGVPIIGLDSLQGEAGTYFVYVKGENGEREKRSITIGEADQYYVQVLSGLEVGELVYYESEALMPSDYSEYTVELSDYVIDNITRTYRLADEQVVWYNAEYGGTIVEFAVKVGDEVEAGDLLYVLRADAGKAALADAQNDIHQENKAYEHRINEIDESLYWEQDEIARKILNFQRELEEVSHAYRLRQLEEAYSEMARNNDGSGQIRVYAKQSGTVTRIPVKEFSAVTEGIEVAKGTHVLSIGREADAKLFVEMAEIKDAKGNITERSYTDNIAEFGESITITAGDVEDNVFRGVCTGWTAHSDVNLGKYYISETEDGIKISFCTDSGYNKPAFYVEMEDESFYENMPMGKVTFSYVAMEDVVVVPTDLVKEERNAKNPTRTDYYVWRVVGNELVKQYVLINKEYSDVYSTHILSGVEEYDILAREK